MSKQIDFMFLLRKWAALNIKDHFVTKKLTNVEMVTLVKIVTNQFAVKEIRATMVFVKMNMILNPKWQLKLL